MFVARFTIFDEIVAAVEPRFVKKEKGKLYLDYGFYNSDAYERVGEWTAIDRTDGSTSQEIIEVPDDEWEQLIKNNVNEWTSREDFITYNLTDVFGKGIPVYSEWGSDKLDAVKALFAELSDKDKKEFLASVSQ